MRDRDTPLPLLRKWLRSCPDAYRQLDSCATANGEDGFSWPDYCPLPINAAYTYLTYARGRSDLDAAAMSAELTACWAWRRSRIIYAVDDDMAEMLFAQAEDMADTDVLPVDLLLHLPYPCIYVKAHHPELPGVDGFFAWIDYDVNCASTELRVQWVYDDMQGTVPQVLHLVPSGTIGDCVRSTLDRTRENVGVDISTVSDVASLGRIILGVIQIILYIISDFIHNSIIFIIPVCHIILYCIICSGCTFCRRVIIRRIIICIISTGGKPHHDPRAHEYQHEFLPLFHSHNLPSYIFIYDQVLLVTSNICIFQKYIRIFLYQNAGIFLHSFSNHTTSVCSQKYFQIRNLFF